MVGKFFIAVLLAVWLGFLFIFGLSAVFIYTSEKFPKHIDSMIFLLAVVIWPVGILGLAWGWMNLASWAMP